MGENSDELFGREGRVDTDRDTPAETDAHRPLSADGLDADSAYASDAYQPGVSPAPYQSAVQPQAAYPQAPYQSAAQPQAAYSSASRPGRAYAAPRPSRESILQSYAAQDAARARNVRMYSQAKAIEYQEHAAQARERAAERARLEEQLRAQEQVRAEEHRFSDEHRLAGQDGGAGGEDALRRARSRDARYRPSRAFEPLSSQESHDLTRMSQEGYERARAARDVLSDERQLYPRDRELIDGRGSIDSRAFNETHELVGYTVDERDRSRVTVDAASQTDARWESHSEDGASRLEDPVGTARLSSSMMGGRASAVSVRQGFLSTVPLLVKIFIPVIIVLVIVLIVLLVR